TQEKGILSIHSLKRDQRQKELMGMVHNNLDIIVAEDDPANQKIIQTLLETLGFSVSICSDGHKAIEAYLDKHCDLIFMDMQMTGMDGVETTLKIRSIEEKEGKKRIPIIALTANALKEDREKCIQGGMDNYITKPVTREKIVSVINQTIPQPKQGPQS